MGNESGEWIMHGMNWDNPDCIHSVDEAIKYIDVYKRQSVYRSLVLQQHRQLSLRRMHN